MSGSEHVLIEDWCQQFPSHSVGSPEFGPEGALYASGGEGASFTATADYGQLGGTLPGTPDAGEPVRGPGRVEPVATDGRGWRAPIAGPAHERRPAGSSTAR